MRRLAPAVAAMLTLAAFLSGCLASNDASARSNTVADDGLPQLLRDGAWQQLPELSVPLAEAGSAQDDDALYLVGGFAPVAGVAEAGGSTVALRYALADPESTELPAYPLPIHHVQLAVLDGTLYAFGGYVSGALLPGTFVAGAGPAGWPETSLAFRLMPGGSMWEPIAPLPAARAAGVAIATNDRILILGGVDDANSYPAETWLYNPADDTYAPGPALPLGRDHLLASRVDDAIIVLAGRYLADAAWTDLRRVDILDLTSNQWRAGADAPVGGGGLAAGVVDGRLWVAGGEVAQGPYAVRDDVNIYDVAADTWIPAPPMPEGRHGLAAAGWDGRFLVFGGALGTGPLTSDVAAFGATVK